MINDTHELLQCRDHSVKANNFSRFSHSARHAMQHFVYHSSIAGCRYHEQFLPISFHVDRLAWFLQSCTLYKTIEYWEIQIFKTRKNKQIETSFCHANTVKFLFISVQLDSGQFQENSQEYLRWTYNYHLMYRNRCKYNQLSSSDDKHLNSSIWDSWDREDLRFDFLRFSTIK